MCVVKALLAKAFLADCTQRLRLCIESVCYGCINDRPSQRDHDVCLSSITEKYQRIFDELIPMADHDHITRLFRDYLYQLDISDFSVPLEYFDREERNKLFLEDLQFKDLVISYAMDNLPLPPPSPVKADPPTPPMKKRKLERILGLDAL